MNDLSTFPSSVPTTTSTGARIVPQPLLSKRAKAAIVVRLLINEGADIALEELPPELQAQLTQQMGAMRVVDRVTLASVVEEFTEALESIGLSFPGGMAGALDALDGKIGRETAARLRKEAGVRAAGDPWKRLRALPAEDLVDIIKNESTEVAAVLLSKLDVPVAAGLLGKISGPEARRITYAVSLTGDVTPEAIDRIGISLAAQLDNKKESVFGTGPAERLGAILNSSSTPTREDVLSGLEETDEILATAVRKAIFTFGNIPARITPRDIPRILREVDGGDLLTAMAGAEAAGFADARDFVLENMSGRMADQLREDMAEAGKIKPAVADEAMSSFVSVIRDMESRGDLVLIVEEEDEDE
ncbi:flagellar motor switch protein FliG [Sulfitobacter donghicola]|uniref:Flagellar motor switch protein FliG n=1 Tax=Sulfitobacter donghicola DSW-25 = KCTC 12864 = JCM 14565 TaxID=1300350 RepID=A0A073IXL1_9RHOB|nr:FliG C-terminal domain-containing protein [Sulfitobacter donghicola]KEJ90117.1 flagellar motor switch protein FliG [Sulfitobacter donghicola DSW-25 = KCTC 12864 = JCM 14565]KIN66730.1 Flagellar motor switch protein FliG [Sulfitobacter donghicola DSW-25 = KCTC 12864 = JCM 14565]